MKSLLGFAVFTIAAGLLCLVRPAIAAPADATIPFVGCKSDGQTGPRDAPTGAGKTFPIDGRIAQQLAFYKAETGQGVLGPRDWHCFGLYGSNGSILIIAPEPLDGAELLARPSAIAGPAIQATESYGDTSGRFAVARIAARVFPAQKDFVQRIIDEGIEPAKDFPAGPYPGDRLNYRSSQVVEYLTPSNTEGLGTTSRLQQSGDPISGVAILLDSTPNLLHVAVRLPSSMSALAPAIVRQAEQDASSRQP
ncbi:MAG TPA: hypothetical protein VNH44_18795 [Micropepsaceae bacterium]|nr:hypothetical protein [Micropepsaceae bacterium]